VYNNSCAIRFKKHFLTVEKNIDNTQPSGFTFSLSVECACTCRYKFCRVWQPVTPNLIEGLKCYSTIETGTLKTCNERAYETTVTFFETNDHEIRL
jgi:hypothetical protein